MRRPRRLGRLGTGRWACTWTGHHHAGGAQDRETLVGDVELRIAAGAHLQHGPVRHCGCGSCNVREAGPGSVGGIDDERLRQGGRGEGGDGHAAGEHGLTSQTGTVPPTSVGRGSMPQRDWPGHPSRSRLPRLGRFPVSGREAAVAAARPSCWKACGPGRERQPPGTATARALAFAVHGEEQDWHVHQHSNAKRRLTSLAWGGSSCSSGLDAAGPAGLGARCIRCGADRSPARTWSGLLVI
jgi:hypothetical protein